MKRFFLLGFFTAITAITGFAQSNADTMPAKENIRLVSRFKNGAVELRWFPASAAAFRKANQLGYTVQRMELNGGGDFATIATVKPYTAAEWQQKTNSNDDLVRATMQAVATQPGDSKSKDFVDMDDEESGIFITYILATSLSADAAKGAGLMYTDNTIVAGKQYAYSVSINSKGKKTDEDETMVFITDTRSAYKSPIPMDLITEEGEGFVKLTWNNTTNKELFSAYNIERSNDGGKTFKKINELPFISVAENTDIIFYTDSVKNYIPFQYRITGLTPWVDISDPSAIVTAMGRDKTPASPPLNTRAKGDRSKIIVSWELPARSGDLKGFQVARSHNLEGPFTTINTKPITTDQRMFVDERPTPKEPYYVVYSVDTAGNFSSTFSVMASVYDSVAPAKPLAVVGTIDSTGAVQLNWKTGSDNDLVGYNVYVANGKDNVFRQITGYPLNDSSFRDTVSMRSLTREVYYKITAIDYNNNASEYSDLVVLKRPDVIPPAAPLISDYAVAGNKVTLTMIGSSSDDVVEHKLNRTDAAGRTTTLVTSKEIKIFTDSTGEEGASYSYILVASDAARHQVASKPLQVTILEQEIKAGIGKLTARANEKDKQVLLNWNTADKSTAATLVLYRSVNGDEMQAYKKISPDKQSYIDNTDTGKYQYAIKVLYSSGAESELSEVAVAEIKN